MGVEKTEDARDGVLVHHCAPRKATKELCEREDAGVFKGRNAYTIPMVGPVVGPFCSGVPDQAVQRWELLLGPMRWLNGRGHTSGIFDPDNWRWPIHRTVGHWECSFNFERRWGSQFCRAVLINSWTVIGYRNRPPEVIRAILRICDHGSSKVKCLVLMYDHGSELFFKSEKHPFFAGSFKTLAVFQMFGNVQNRWFFHAAFPNESEPAVPLFWNTKNPGN